MVPGRSWRLVSIESASGTFRSVAGRASETQSVQGIPENAETADRTMKRDADGANQSLLPDGVLSHLARDSDSQETA